MPQKLEGKTAVITGGTEWIGLATAKLFVKEGAYVFTTGLRLKLGTASQNKIAEVHRVEKSPLSRSLKLMEESGWIKLERRGQNVDVEMTKAGKDIFCKSVDGWRKAQANLKHHLRNEGVDAVEVLAASLAKF